MIPDPKAGEKLYYAHLGVDGLEHARRKPFSDKECGKYLWDLGALLQMLEPAPRSILDLGCGTGWTSRLLAKCGYEVLGVDISADAIRIARELAVCEGVGNVRFATVDFEEIDPRERFDYVLFYDALHHAEDEKKAVEIAYASLKENGILFALEPGAGHSRSSGARHAVQTFQVHEKDMPPHYIWRLGRAAGFRRRIYLPGPRDIGKGFYRRDFTRSNHWPRFALERLWGYIRVITRIGLARSSGLTVMWK